ACSLRRGALAGRAIRENLGLDERGVLAGLGFATIERPAEVNAACSPDGGEAGADDHHDVVSEADAFAHEREDLAPPRVARAVDGYVEDGLRLEACLAVDAREEHLARRARKAVLAGTA